eukprot:TRINITY_DN3282_c0_g2_i1.p1 TRINITY_DN3282_c0_g2~~TRINITY_DN3282_c0_g2_i1.p1  ORF type:complete len:165 (+),score=30.95 TRINITY_DN3282_c0_g2_i1:277-771(+)
MSNLLGKTVSFESQPDVFLFNKKDPPIDTILSVVSSNVRPLNRKSKTDIIEEPIVFETDDLDEPLFSLDLFGEQKVKVDTNKLNNAQLHQELENRGLVTKGTKIEKLERLEAWIRKEKQGSVKEDHPHKPKYRQEKKKLKEAPTWLKNKSPLQTPPSSLPPGWR